MRYGIPPRSGVLALVLCTFWFRAAEARGPSTPEERRQVIARIHDLEQQPLGEDATASRAALLTWAIELPEIRFHRCKELLGSGLDAYPYAREVNDQVMLSSVAFTLERQDKMRDALAAYVAGVEGALRVYDVLRRSRPDAQSPYLDELIRKRDRGELASHVERVANEKCPRSNRLLVLLPGVIVVDLAFGLLIGWLFTRRRTERGRRTSIAHGIVVGCASYYVIVIALLHVIEPDYDPRFRFLSEYQWSGHGWLMTTTFFVLGAATLTTAFVIRAFHRATSSARLGAGLLVLGALGVCIAGAFRGFPLHDVGSGMGLPSVALATLVLSWSFRGVNELRALVWPGLAIGLAMLAALFSIAIDIGMPGIQQRSFLGVFLLWLVSVTSRSSSLRVDRAPST